MYSEELQAKIGLSHFEGIGPMRYRLLKSYFGSASKIYNASKSELESTGLGNKIVEKFVSFRDHINLQSIVQDYKEKSIHVITEDDKSYPEQLKHLKDSPFILYAIGDVSLLQDELLFAIVGTRMPTSYGVEVTKNISSGLSRNGFTIVSGMAMGVDTIAHSAVLEDNGRTVAVLGCGVDICYPAVNRAIYDTLKKKGLIISEFPPGTRTSKGVFPSRNRIVAGLSLGVLVTQGAERSGSLITARYASEYGKDVFAIPGPITTQMSEATTLLLKEGAHPVSSEEDIISMYKKQHNKSKSKKKMQFYQSLSDLEKLVIEEIEKSGSCSIDILVRITGNPTTLLLPVISSLEIQGIIVEVDDGEYSLAL